MQVFVSHASRDAVRRGSKPVQALRDALDALDEFVVARGHSDELEGWYEAQDFESECDTGLQDFWEEHFDARIPADR